MKLLTELRVGLMINNLQLKDVCSELKISRQGLHKKLKNKNAIWDDWRLEILEKYMSEDSVSSIRKKEEAKNET